MMVERLSDFNISHMVTKMSVNVKKKSKFGFVLNVDKVVFLLLLFFFVSGSFVTVFSSVLASDVVEDSWNTKAPMNYPRYNFGAVAVDGKIYAIGGVMLSYSADSSAMTVGTNERYDPKADKWVTLASMPTPRSDFVTSIVACQNRIYCISRGLTQVYDIAANSWSTKAALPSGNSVLGAHVVDGKIFVTLNSYNLDLHTFGSIGLYMYDAVADSWIAKASVPVEYPIGYSFVMDGKLMISGPFKNPDDTVVTKILVYDPNTDVWSDERIISGYIFRPAVVTSGLYAPQKIYSPQTLSRDAQYIDLSDLNIDIFAQAGMTEINVAELHTYTRVYDPVSDIWVNGTGVPTSRMWPGVVVVDDVLYVIGGVSHGESLAVNEQYVPFGYHGTLPSGSWFSLDNTVFVAVIAIVLIVAILVVLMFSFRKTGKPVQNSSGSVSLPSSVLI